MYILFSFFTLMKKNKNVLWLVFILFIIIWIIFTWIFLIKSDKDSIIQNITNTDKIIIKKPDIPKKDIKININEPLLTKKEKIKSNFNNFCSDITSIEKIKNILKNDSIIIDLEIKKSLISYINNEISLSDIENILLEKIGNADNENMKEQRLYLNYFFLVFNDIKRWNTTNCDKIFTQYYK